MKKIAALIFLFSSLAALLALASPHLDVPGLNIDEAVDGAVAGYIGATRAAVPAEPMSVIYAWELGGRFFPLMQGPYTGIVADYFLYPFLKLLGPSASTLRLAAIIFCLLTLVAIYFCLKTWFGDIVAGITVCLLGVNPLFVQYGRLAFHREEVFVLGILWAALCALARYYSRGERFFLLLSAWLWGTGLACKITFAWYLLPMTALWPFFPQARRLSGRLAGQTALFFLLGALPLVAFNIHKPLVTARYLWDSLFHPSDRLVAATVRVDNLAYWGNLKFRAAQFARLLADEVAIRRSWGALADPAFWPQFRAFNLLLSTAAIIFFYTLALRGKGLRAWRAPVRFLALFYLIVFLETPFSVHGLDPGHLLVLLPFPQLATAILCMGISRPLRSRPALRSALLGLVLAPMLASSVYANVFWGRQMRVNGGRGRWSTAIYSLARYLDENNFRAPVSFGYAVDQDIVFLTRGRIFPIMCRDASPASIENSYRQAAAQGRGTVYYLWAGTEDESGEARRGFELYARRKGAKIVLKNSFLNSSGRRVYRLYEIYPH